MDQLCNIELSEFVSQSKMRLKKILDRLDWAQGATLQDFNTNSVASSSKKVPRKPCSLAKASYPDSCITKNSLVLETSALQKLLQSNHVQAPCNFRELQENFSREQKLTIYEHVIRNTEKLENTSIEPKIEGETSLADILAQKKREEKTKKRRFRKSKPTHIEEVRCLVDLQMQSLQQFIENKLKKYDIAAPRTTSSTKIERQTEKPQSSHVRSRFEDYYEGERNIEKFSNHVKINNRRHHRSRSKEYISYIHKRHERSYSREISSKRKRGKSRERKRSRSSSTEIRRNRSRSKEKKRIHYEEASTNRKRRRSYSADRYDKSRNYKTSKEDPKYRSFHSYQSYSRREENDYNRHHLRKGPNCSYSEHANEKYTRKYSKSTERNMFDPQSIKEPTKNKYCNEENKYTKTNIINEKDKYTEYKTLSKDHRDVHKSSKHKKKKK